MQRHVVIARFDTATDRLLTQWKEETRRIQNIRCAETAEWPAHMTIAAYEDVDANALCEWAAEYASGHRETEVHFGSLGIFPHGESADTSVIFAHPNNTAALAALYYGFHQRLDEYCGEYGRHYAMGSRDVVFHSTIAMCGRGELNRVLSHLCSRFCVIRGKVTALEVYENPLRLIGRFALRPATDTACPSI